MDSNNSAYGIRNLKGYVDVSLESGKIKKGNKDSHKTYKSQMISPVRALDRSKFMSPTHNLDFEGIDKRTQQRDY